LSEDALGTARDQGPCRPQALRHAAGKKRQASHRRAVRNAAQFSNRHVGAASCKFKLPVIAAKRRAVYI